MARYVGKLLIIATFTLYLFMGIGGHVGAAAACNVLVVMGTEETFFRSIEIKAGIEDTIGDQCDMTYMYLDSLSQPEGVEAKAQKAYAQYQAMQPDGVIATNDETQQYFVIPYLKDKVETPVMFAQIFAPPDVYGYPASNVSGIRSHWPVQDALVFAQQLVPSITKVGFLVGDEIAGHSQIQQIEREKETYPVTMLDPVLAKTPGEAVSQAKALKEQCDALYIGPISSLMTAPGDQSLLADIGNAFGKVTLTNIMQYVEAGVLCGVKDFGEEQGRVASTMLLQAMQGTPVSELPITKNQYGGRLMNVATLKALGIRPSQSALAGVELIRSAK
jgi:ABC-type uncharacterized transport system substrate-binding protein